jgi:23S rRNA G2445 N2-methylase RlmL
VRLRRADVTRPAVPAGSVDRVVANPPWGATVAARGGLRSHPCSLWPALARLLAGQGTLVALVPADAVAPRALRSAGLDGGAVASVRVAGTEAVILRADRL